MSKLTNSSKIFESNIRLQMIASLLESELTYRELKEICNCTDGNMATHTKKVIDEGFVVTRKEFVNGKPQTTYILTEKGKKEFIAYMKVLEELCERVDLYEEDFHVDVSNVSMEF